MEICKYQYSRKLNDFFLGKLNSLNHNNFYLRSHSRGCILLSRTSVRLTLSKIVIYQVAFETAIHLLSIIEKQFVMLI